MRAILITLKFFIMSNIPSFIFSFAFLFLLSPNLYSIGDPPVDKWRQDFAIELRQNQNEFVQKGTELHRQLENLNLHLSKLPKRKKKAFNKLLQNKIELQIAIQKNESSFNQTTLDIRYRKGIDLIKLLYEKILGLEHHFSSMQTYQNVASLSNPNSYPEFKEAKQMLTQNQHKKFGLKMPSLLETNPFMSATYTIVSLFLSPGDQVQKEKDFEDVACILDFTVRMNGDLNTIRHEVEFLKKANDRLKLDCEKLFEEYTKVVGYHVPLEKCRQIDDWGTLDVLIKTNSRLSSSQNKDSIRIAVANEVNLEFATRRVSDFISQYINFTNRGTQYYEKFSGIVSGYENEVFCGEHLPHQFSDLKFDIENTIEKFNNTYHMPEIQGSRLKDLMYGQL